MLAQFSIWPLDNPHMSEDVAGLAEVLDQLDIRYELGPMGTTLEGEWNEVMEAIHACHETLRTAHQRVLTNISIDDDATRSLTISDATGKVAAQRSAVTQ